MSQQHYDNLIVDGNNFLFRAFYSKRPARVEDGLNTTPIYQALYMLRALAEWYSPNNIYFTWDKRLNEDFVNFRRGIVQEYKENRIDTDDKKNVLSYMEIIVEFCNALGVKTIFPYDLEGDDVIYYLGQKLEGTSLIISSDRDLLQLVNRNIHQLIPTKNTIITLDNFEEFTTVRPEAFLLYKAILGDKSDNIPGLPKYGEVRAKALAEKLVAYTLGEDTQQVLLNDEQESIVKNNLKIMNLSAAVNERPTEHDNYDHQMTTTKDIAFNADTLRDLFWKYNFGNFVREFGIWKTLFDKTPNDAWWENALDYVVM
jgi:DNA polymerase-1